MDIKEKKITIPVSDKEYVQLYQLAKESGSSLPDFIKSMAILFIDNKTFLSQFNLDDSKKSFEQDLQKMAQHLEKKQQFIDLLLRSIYSTQLRLEGQFKKVRKEAEKEYKKDINRISLIVESSTPDN